MNQKEALVIANRLVTHFDTTEDIMHSHSKDALPDIVALRDWVAAQQSVEQTVPQEESLRDDEFSSWNDDPGYW